MNAENITKPSRMSVLNILLLVFVFFAGAVASHWLPWPDAAPTQQVRTDVPRFAAAPPMDARFKDADGDLLADPPANDEKSFDPETLTFSYLAVDDQTVFKEAWSDFLTHLSKVTGKPAKYVIYGSTKAQIEAMALGQLHVAAFNTGAVSSAVNSAGFVPFCALTTPSEPKVYQMEIVVPASSLIKTSADLRGKTLCLTDESSNSGCKAPLCLLKKEFGLEAGKDYSVRYSGGHYPSLVLVTLGEVDAAAVASSVHKRFEEARPSSAGKIRTIYKSGDFPAAAIGYAHDLSPALVKKIREAFDTFEWKGTSLERQYPGGEVKPVDYKNDWKLVREIDQALAH